MSLGSRSAAWFLAGALLCVHAGPVAAQARVKPPSSPTPTLSAEKQQYIWDTEHISFVIETYLGKPWIGELRRGERKKARARLSGGFRGRLFTAPATDRRDTGAVVERRRSVPASPTGPVDANAFVRALSDILSGFARVDRARLHVLHIDRTDAEQGIWSTVLRLAVVGTGKDSLPREHLSRYEVELRFTSEDQLQAGKGVIARAEIQSELFRTSRGMLLEEVTEQVGLAELPLIDNWKLSVADTRNHRYQMAVEDYDRDGYPDIVIGSTHGQPLLLHSVLGKRFEDVTEGSGLRASHDTPVQRDVNALAAWIDYDDDGWPDLLLGGRLYHNEQGRGFADVASGAGLKFERSPFGAMVADFDADGDLDLYILNQKGFRQRPRNAPRPWVGDPEAGTGNHLWSNQGGGRFKNVTAETGAAAGRHQTFAASTFFFDDDHFPDLYLANDFGTNVLLRSRGDGTFEDVTRRTGTGDFSTSMGVATGDLDNDGSTELYVANMYSKMGRRIVAHLDESDYLQGVHGLIIGSLAGNRLYYKGEDNQRFEEVSDELGVNAVGWAYAPAMVDLDGDGLLDLYATTGFLSYDRDSGDG